MADCRASPFLKVKLPFVGSYIIPLFSLLSKGAFLIKTGRVDLSRRRRLCKQPLPPSACPDGSTCSCLSGLVEVTFAELLLQAENLLHQKDTNQGTGNDE